MQKSLWGKFIIMGVLCTLFLIGLLTIRGLIDERAQYRQGVIDEIRETQIDEQTLTMPFVLLDNKTPVFASTSTINGKVRVKDDQYVRGIYKATSYQANLHIKQQYASTISSAPTKATLYIPISDLRGVGLPSVNINGTRYATKFSTSAWALGKSFLQVDFIWSPNLSIDFALPLAGLSGLHIVPLGEQSNITLDGDWREVKFHGNALPQQKTLNQNGFVANWHTDFLAQQNNSAIKAYFDNCQDCDIPSISTLSATFVDTNSIYTKTERTIKYAWFILAISFGAFFLFEVIKGLKIHPIEYLLVGAGLLVFYALLLSLSELMLFWQAYALASLASVGLLTWYSGHLLQSFGKSMLFGAILGGLYASFYVVLSARQMNLLFGSLLCFVLLFVAMFITRKIDWYAPPKSTNTDNENANALQE